MKVHLVVKDNPEEWGGLELLGAYEDRAEAVEESLKLKGRNAFANQYVDVKSFTLRLRRTDPKRRKRAKTLSRARARKAVGK